MIITLFATGENNVLLISCNQNKIITFTKREKIIMNPLLISILESTCGDTGQEQD